MKNPEAIFGQAVTCFREGRLQEADALAGMVLGMRPGHAEATFMRGLIAQNSGQFDRAAALYSQAASLDRKKPSYQYQLGMLLKDMGRLEDAVVALEAAVALKPRYLEAHYCIGLVRGAMGALEASLAAFERVLRIDPGYAPALKQKAFLLWKLGQKEQSLQVCERLTRLSPNDPGAYYNLGNVLNSLCRLEEAELAFRRAIGINPDYAEAYSNLGIVLKDMCRLGDAEEIYRKALQLDPGNRITHSNLLFLLSAREELDRDAMLAEFSLWEGRHGCEVAPFWSGQPGRCQSGRRLRIGYVSADFRAHAVSSFFEPVLLGHDRDRFEIFCYSSHDAYMSDAVTERLKVASEHWRDIAGLGDTEAAGKIFEDEIDVLVDLGGHTGGNRLGIFACRPARIQATYIGYFASTGLTSVDYWITDEVVHPVTTREPCVERIYRLPRCHLCYLPSPSAPPVSPSPNKGRDVVFCSVSDISKLTGDVISVWSRILRKLPGSRLLLTTRALAEPKNRSMLLRRFAASGVDETQIRMHSTLVHDEWLANYASVDVILDPFPRTGTTTTAEALWMGVPVIALAGDRYVSRASTAVLHAVGMQELVASNAGEYVDKAVALAGDPERREQIRDHLRARMAASPLRDAAGLARALENAYCSMLGEG